ncbi:MAG: histidine kinase [Agitococcus sp.]|nr:histidine kinase [Agitococcus sp.]
MPKEDLLNPLFLALAANFDDCLLVCDADGQIIYANPSRYCDNPPLLLGKNIYRVLPLKADLEVLAGLNIGISCWIADQSYDIRIQRVFNNTETSLFFCWIRPATAGSTWQSWLENLPVPLALRDCNGNYLWANNRYTRRYSATGVCINGQHISTILCEEACQKMLDADRYVLETGLPTLFEYVSNNPDGDSENYLVVQSLCKLPGHDRAILTVVEEREKLCIEVPCFKEAEIRYQQLTRHLMTKMDNHHAAVARDLHDMLGQNLIGIKLAIHNAMARGQASEDMTEAMKYWMKLLDESISFIRNFTHNLHPRLLQEFGLRRALLAWLEQTRQHSSIIFDVRIDEELTTIPPVIKNACLRIAQEAVTNSLKHSNASQLQVRLLQRDGLLTLSVNDNGKGFRATGTPKCDQGLGLISMKERCHLSGGVFMITSHPGHGTTVTANWPII